MHTGDAEERELFERLEREFADVRVPRLRPGSPRRSGGLPRTRRMLVWAVVLGLGLWSLQHTPAGRGLVAPVASWLRETGPAPEGEYVFLQETSTGPVRWSSCREIEVVVNDALRPVEAGDVVERAVAEVAQVSGLTITVVGRTDEVPSRQRPAEQPRYGLGWAPVLVAWTTPEVDPDLAGDTVGMGGAAAVRDGSGVARYVTGQITLDAPQIADILERPYGDDQTKAIVMHEVAHVLGLGHVESGAEVMNEGNGPGRLGPGDVAGLQVAGNGPCL